MDQASFQSRSADPTAIGHFVFDEVTAAWKRGSPIPHAAAKVRVEIDRNSYRNRGRTREMRTPIRVWSFPESGAQVCMIPPNMVEAMRGSGLVVAANLQITDAGGHALPVEGAIFVVISRQDKRTGLIKKTHQMVYLCKKTEELVLSREAMTQLGMVTADIDDAASVCQITSSTPSSTSGVQDGNVTGGQLTLDLIVSHNQMFPDKQVSSRDLLPSDDPDHACKGTLP